MSNGQLFAAVDMHDNGEVIVTLRGGATSREEGNGPLKIAVGRLEHAEALRDALSAFIAFHKPRQQSGTMDDETRRAYAEAEPHRVKDYFWEH
jgi:hypothetical protein